MTASVLKQDQTFHLHVVFCPNKQHSFEPYMCLDHFAMINIREVVGIMFKVEKCFDTIHMK